MLIVVLGKQEEKLGETSEEQFGFAHDKATRNAIFTLRMISERCIEMKKNIYICLIDYVKAFDKVKHEVLFQQLEQLDINGKDLELLKNLYWEQKATVRYDDVVLRHTFPVFTGLGRCPIVSWDFVGAVSIFGPDALPVVHQ